MAAFKQFAMSLKEEFVYLMFAAFIACVVVMQTMPMRTKPVRLKASMSNDKGLHLNATIMYHKKPVGADLNRNGSAKAKSSNIEEFVSIYEAYKSKFDKLNNPTLWQGDVRLIKTFITR